MLDAVRLDNARRVRQAKKSQARMQREGLVDEAAQTGPGARCTKESDVFARLSNREIEFYREVFEKIDVDGSGEIDEEEVCAKSMPACACHVVQTLAGNSAAWQLSAWGRCRGGSCCRFRAPATTL